MPTPRRTAAAAVAAAVLLVACTTPAADPPEPTGTAPSRSGLDRWPLGAVRLPAAVPATTAEPPRPDRTPAAGAAAATVVDLLEAEGLSVLELTTSLHRPTPSRAEVVVRVLHGTGDSHPHDSRFRVRLARDEDGWIVAAVEAAP